MSEASVAQALATMDEQSLMLGIGFIGILLAGIVLLSVVWYFVSAIGYYKMFQKAGQAGWKAFIPYYNDFIRFQFAWNKKAFWVYLASVLVFQFFSGSENMIAEFVALVCGIVFLVVAVKMDLRVAKSFGKGTGWGVLLFFFPFVVTLILGFGKAEYIGNTTVSALDEGNI